LNNLTLTKALSVVEEKIKMMIPARDISL